MPQQPSSTQSPRSPGKGKLVLVIIIGIVIVIIIAGSFVGATVYQAAQQPNIQATAINIAQPAASPRTANALDDGRVSNSGSFDYTTGQSGTYILVFDNSFSTFSTKSVGVTYNVAGSDQTRSFSVPPGTTQQISYNLATGQRIHGSFTIAGGSGNDINFYITASTCSETVSFSFTLVNPGPASGFATVHFTVDGQTQWSNRYLVPNGGQVPATGSVTLPDCNSHTMNIVVSAQEKA